MAGVILGGSFNNPTLPSSKSLVHQVSEIPGLVGWFQSDIASVETDQSGIVQFNDVAGSQAVFYRNSRDNQASLDNAQLESYSASLFNASDSANGLTDCYVLQGADIAPDSPYTYVVVFKQSAAVDADGDALISRFTSSVARSLFHIDSGSNRVSFIHGNTPSPKHTFSKDKWCVLVGSFDGTSLKLIGDNITYPPVVASGTAGAADIIFGALNAYGGQPFKGWISDVMLFDRDIISSEQDLSIVKEYMRLVYGLEM